MLHKCCVTHICSQLFAYKAFLMLWRFQLVPLRVNKHLHMYVLRLLKYVENFLCAKKIKTEKLKKKSHSFHRLKKKEKLLSLSVFLWGHLMIFTRCTNFDDYFVIWELLLVMLSYLNLSKTCRVLIELSLIMYNQLTLTTLMTIAIYYYSMKIKVVVFINFPNQITKL